MGVEKEVVTAGNGTDFPKKHDEVSMEYTGISQVCTYMAMKQLLTSSGWLYDELSSNKKGKQ